METARIVVDVLLASLFDFSLCHYLQLKIKTRFIPNPKLRIMHIQPFKFYEFLNPSFDQFIHSEEYITLVAIPFQHANSVIVVRVYWPYVEKYILKSKFTIFS